MTTETEIQKRKREKTFEYIGNCLTFDPKGSHELESSYSTWRDVYMIKPKEDPVGLKVKIPFMKWYDIWFTQSGKIILKPGGTFGSKIPNVKP